MHIPKPNAMSCSMMSQIPNYNKNIRDSNGSNSSKYRRRTNSADKLLNMQLLHRKKDLDSNQFESHYLNLIRQAHQDCQGNLEALKMVFLQNSLKRRQSIGIVRMVHHSIIRKHSSISLGLYSNIDQPFEVI